MTGIFAGLVLSGLIWAVVIAAVRVMTG